MYLMGMRLMYWFPLGPILRSSLLNVRVELHEFRTTRETAAAMMSAAVAQCVQQACKQAQPALLEPMMNLQVSALHYQFTEIKSPEIFNYSEII